jgi:hypothetical protein
MINSNRALFATERDVSSVLMKFMSCFQLQMLQVDSRPEPPLDIDPPMVSAALRNAFQIHGKELKENNSS